MHATYDGLIGTFGVVLARCKEAWKRRGLFGAITMMTRLLLQVLLTPLYYITMGQKTFRYRGKAYRYFCHWYNTTFLNERAVEIAVALAMLKKARGKRILEIGNVLSHYTDVTWQVLDKYEKGKGVINEDVVDFHPNERYDLIISISTMEHVGFDEHPKDATKYSRAIENLKTLLAPGGSMFVTIPVGYNPDSVNDSCHTNLFETTQYLKHVSALRWEEVSKEEALQARFYYPYQFGNAVIFCMVNM